MVRLQKFIADCGVTSRRKAELLIEQGKVKVNGKTCTTLGTKVDPNTDVISLDNQIISLDAVCKTYIVLNKPRGVLATISDPEGRKTVLDIIPPFKERLYPVGRLDFNSEGLLILTNDGDLAQKLAHPSYGVVKVYEVKVFGAINSKILAELKKERQFPEGKVKPESVRVIEQLPQKTWIEIRLTEGRNREIRRICEEVGISIDKLRRVAIGGLALGSLRAGDFRMPTERDLLAQLGKVDGKIGSNKYVSNKRTVDLLKKGPQPTRLATDRYYQQYNKENYRNTIESRKEAASSFEKPSYQR